MRKRRLTTLIGCALALGALGAQPAGAASQVGSTCTASGVFPEGTLVGLANGPESPFPAAVGPPGVLTRWTLNLPPGPPPPVLFSGGLKILRPTGAPDQFQAVAESTGTVTAGPQAFPARIPVQTGDRLAFVIRLVQNPSQVFSFYCSTGKPGDVIGTIKGDLPAGASTIVTDQEAGGQIPVLATVEPDVDGDGFGDETQDRCPQSAASQEICPSVAIDASSLIKRRGSVVVLVTTSSPAPVTVNGFVNLGKKKKAQLGSKAQTVVPGKVSRFTLRFPRKLTSRLKDLARKRSLQLKVAASATDPIGRVTGDILKTKLKGQAPKKKEPRSR